MAKKKLPDPFSKEICQRLRKFDLRDELEQQISECSDGETKKIEKLKAQHYDVVHEIARWQDLYKTTNNKIIEAIEKGDELELISHDEPEPDREVAL